MNAVSPGTPAMRTGTRPASRADGRMTPSLDGDANTTRATASPIRTSGSVGPSTTNPAPATVMRPPSIARSGWTEVMRAGDMGDWAVEVSKYEVRSMKHEAGPFPFVLRTFYFVRRTLCIVQLDVPVEVVAPAFGRVPQSDRDPDGRRRGGPFRHPPQVHAGFGRRAPPLLPVAVHAAGDNILPVLAAALGDR